MYSIPTIKTKRFLIKKLTLRNVNKIYLSWFRDPVINKNIITSNSVNKGGIKYLKLYVKKKIKKKNILFLGIFTKKKTHIGNIKFEPISIHKKTAIAGILIGHKKWRGKGVLKEVFPNICKSLHKYYGILRIELGAANTNKIAMTAYKRIGFKRLKSSDTRLIRKTNSANIYVYNIF